MLADPRAESERVIVAAIEKYARGDVAALAPGIIEELRAAGLEIRRTDARRGGAKLGKGGAA
jgi:hypothetical protein